MSNRNRSIFEQNNGSTRGYQGRQQFHNRNRGRSSFENLRDPMNRYDGDLDTSTVNRRRGNPSNTRGRSRRGRGRGFLQDQIDALEFANDYRRRGDSSSARGFYGYSRDHPPFDDDHRSDYNSGPSTSQTHHRHRRRRHSNFRRGPNLSDRPNNNQDTVNPIQPQNEFSPANEAPVLESPTRYQKQCPEDSDSEQKVLAFVSPKRENIHETDNENSDIDDPEVIETVLYIVTTVATGTASCESEIGPSTSTEGVNGSKNGTQFEEIIHKDHSGDKENDEESVPSAKKPRMEFNKVSAKKHSTIVCRGEELNLLKIDYAELKCKYDALENRLKAESEQHQVAMEKYDQEKRKREEAEKRLKEVKEIFGGLEKSSDEMMTAVEDSKYQFHALNSLLSTLTHKGQK